MTSITFDTLEFVRNPENNGFSKKQTLSKALETHLAAKQDIWQVHNELKLHRWMLGLIIVVLIVPIIKVFLA
jgi:hypothetical protein